ncbi:MAG: hypothetical protein N2Z62_04795 [Rhodobacteraceae bacterium]|nr:hypothetical protein [Paracoccaceae bacterium]
MSLRVALVDGPLAADHPRVGRRVVLRGAAAPGAAGSPAAVHAAALAGAVLARAPEAVIDSLVVFDGGLATDAASVAAALEAAGGAQVVLCAFGLARDDPAIAAAAAALLAGGALVVAAAPARGGPVWHAALPGVIAVQGDARCAPGQWSHLAEGRFGACPLAAEGVRGASAAAGHLAGHAARLLAEGRSAPLARAALAAGAAFRGRERRMA